MVGKNIAEHHYAHNYEILKPTSFELNLMDYESIHNYIRANRPVMVIHAAGTVGGIHANIAEPVKFLFNNTQIGLNIVMASKINKVKRFINLSSSCMYPRDAKSPLTEDLILKGELEPTNEGYAIAKVTTTRLCEYIHREDNSYLYKTIIPCNLFGRYDKFDIQNSHMIPAVIKKIHHAKRQNLKSIDIWGNGRTRREFMYTSDLADFVFYAVNQFERMPQNINVGLGYDFSIKEYYEKIADVIGYSGKFTYDLSRPTGMRQKLVDITKLKVFGWQSKTSLEQGIRKTYEYFLNEAHYD